MRECDPQPQNGGSMKDKLTTLKRPAVISFAVLVPFLLMEWMNRRSLNEGFPIPLFGILWALAMGFVLLMTPIVRNVQAGNMFMMNRANLLLRLTFLVLIAWVWGSIILDQMPCFLGVPACD